LGRRKEDLAVDSKATRFTSENQPKNRGRKKKLPALDDLLASILGSEGGDVENSTAKEVFDSLVKEAKRGNVSAAIAVLNRAYGMPKQAVEHSGAFEVKNGGEMSDAQLAALKAASEIE
jgi:hypothetical protein